MKIVKLKSKITHVKLIFKKWQIFSIFDENLPKYQKNLAPPRVLFVKKKLTSSPFVFSHAFFSFFEKFFPKIFQKIKDPRPAIKLRKSKICPFFDPPSRSRTRVGVPFWSLFGRLGQKGPKTRYLSGQNRGQKRTWAQLDQVRARSWPKIFQKSTNF